MKFVVNAVSDPGLVREHNEDMVLINSDLFRDDSTETEFERNTAEEPVILSVSDGMGGHSAGDIASATVLRELAVAMNGLGKGLAEDELRKYFTETIEEIHNGLLEEARRDPSKKGMGATLIALLFYNGKIYFINAGDSRLYRFRRGILKQISKDHSLAEAAGYDRGSTHVLLNSVGGGEYVTVDFYDITDSVISEDKFLLCSDGLTDLVDDDTIEEILNVNPDPAVLVNEAKKNGGNDNISIIIAEVIFAKEKKGSGNEFLELVNSEREGLEQMDNYEAFEYIKDNKLEPVTVHSTKNIDGEDATIEVYKNGDVKIVISTVEHETVSEGTLHFKTSYGNVKESK